MVFVRSFEKSALSKKTTSAPRGIRFPHISTSSKVRRTARGTGDSYRKTSSIAFAAKVSGLDFSFSHCPEGISFIAGNADHVTNNRHREWGTQFFEDVERFITRQFIEKSLKDSI